MTPQFTSKTKEVHKISVPYETLKNHLEFLDQKPSAYIYQVGEAKSNQPLVMILPPWLNSADSLVGWRAFKESVPARLSRLHEQKHIPGCLAVFPRLFTNFGGSQFVDSPMIGNHATWVARELLDFLINKHSISAEPRDRIVMGRSSGGFASIRFAIDFPGAFGKVLCHSGDMGFDIMLQRDVVFLAGHLQKYNLNIDEFLKYAQNAKKLSGSDLHALMLIGYSAFYSGDKSKNYNFPACLKTAELNTHWQKWLDQDPLVRIKNLKNSEAIKQLDYLYLDCGNKDQYYLQYGMRQLKESLAPLGIDHDIFEFDDNHSGTEYRFDTSLKLAFEN